MHIFRKGIFFAGFLLFATVFAGCEFDPSAIFDVGKEVPSIFELGDTVPDFTMPDQYGVMRTLSDELAQAGMNGAVLAFYIKDNTPG